jgi:hypothetical protein
MFLKKKKRISELINTISEMLEVICQLKEPVTAVSDCLAAIDAIISQVEQEEVIPQKSMEQLQIVKSSLYSFLNDVTQINELSTKDLNNQIFLLDAIFQEEVIAKLNILFLPYKASMWDSLATVFEAASRDEECVAHVVPIPYYQLSQNESIPTYEGDRFPKNVPITHYSQYSLEEQEPDIIYVHNIYDGNNTLTRVFDQYYTTNLKKYTDMLVFVPYHSPHFMFRDIDRRSLGYSTPSIKNVDKIILANDIVKNAALQDGIADEKILVLGSPKIDSMVKALKDNISYPEEWKDKLEGKIVYLVNTGCLFFANDPFLAMEKLLDIFNIPRFLDNSIVIWRPHPLTKVSILRYTPHFSGYYLNFIERYNNVDNPLYRGVIIDETDDYIPALKVADVLVSTNGSLLRSYLLTENKVIYWDENRWENSLLPNSELHSNVFYYAFDKSEPWNILARKFSEGYDPLAEKRKGMAAKAYVNIDGGAGRKIHNAIKECISKENIIN